MKMSKKIVTSNEIVNGRFVVLAIEEKAGANKDKRKMSYVVLDAELKTVASCTNKQQLETVVKGLIEQFRVETQKELEEQKAEQEQALKEAVE